MFGTRRLPAKKSDRDYGVPRALQTYSSTAHGITQFGLRALTYDPTYAAPRMRERLAARYAHRLPECPVLNDSLLVFQLACGTLRFLNLFGALSPTSHVYRASARPKRALAIPNYADQSLKVSLGRGFSVLISKHTTMDPAHTARGPNSSREKSLTNA